MSESVKENKIVVFGIYAFSAVVYLIVILLHKMPQAENAPFFIGILPLLNAMINGTCFLLLLSSLYFIKRKNVAMHKKLNTYAMLLSVVFLLSYVTNHYFSGDTFYGGDSKTLYYVVLISHIVLAGISLPFILLAYYRGFIGDVLRHKSLVRKIYPVWLYVTFTGVLVYIFLAPYY
jgi:putative membrane protein